VAHPGSRQRISLKNSHSQAGNKLCCYFSSAHIHRRPPSQGAPCESLDTTGPDRVQLVVATQTNKADICGHESFWFVSKTSSQKVGTEVTPLGNQSKLQRRHVAPVARTPSLMTAGSSGCHIHFVCKVSCFCRRRDHHKLL